jgi:hypothetical protein
MPPHKKSRCSLSILLAMLEGIGKRDRKYVGRLERVLFIRVTLPPFDKYNRFQLANRLSILPTTSSQLDLVLKGAPNGRPRYFEGGEKTPQPKMPASSSMLSTRPTGTKTDLSKLIFNPETASKDSNSIRR